MLLTRLALYSALGLTLNALDQSVTSAGFWCVVGLFWASETLTRTELIQQLNDELAALKKRLQGQLNNEQEHKP